MNDILENIEEIRKQKGYKQAYVAQKLGIGQTAYSNYVRRSNDISIGRLSRIAEVLGVSVVDIITYPVKYIPESEQKKDCPDCKAKDELIATLNDYIRILKKQEKNGKN